MSEITQPAELVDDESPEGQNVSDVDQLVSYGWALCVPQSGIGDKHVIPFGDLRTHDYDDGCWCHPIMGFDEEEDDIVWHHHAKDGREAYEAHTRLPH